MINVRKSYSLASIKVKDMTILSFKLVNSGNIGELVNDDRDMLHLFGGS